jgi:leucyl-tRNA synthetase
MFMGPLEVSKPWSPQGVEGARKFLNRVWTFFTNEDNWTAENDGALDRVFHQTVKKVSGDFESLGFNTAISQMMIFVNACYKNGTCPKAYAEDFVKMLSCICPHIGEEMWQILGHEGSLALEPWPAWDEEKIKEDTIQIPVQVNGKVRATVEVGVEEGQEAVLEKAHAMKNVQTYTEGKTIVKEIYVKGRIVNIVVK